MARRISPDRSTGTGNRTEPCQYHNQDRFTTTDTPDLTKHLKTADFFDVAKYPEATFVSTAIKPVERRARLIQSL